MAAEAPILVETRDRKMFITFNRPEVLNAQNDSFRLGLVDALDRFEADDGLGVALLRGNGRAFSVGADLKEPRPRSDWDHAGTMHFDRLDRCRKPLIACMHGYGLGGGLEVALCCDIRVATKDALLGTPEARTIGGMPGVAVHRLGRMIPLGEALKVMLTAEPISGRRAYDIGLVQEIAPDRESMLEAGEILADQILACNPSAMLSIKQVVRTPVELEMSLTERLASLGRIDPLVRPAGNPGAYLAERKTARQSRQEQP
ncbi:MAG TPA: enoyl-CoA hydratase/isomerase family protein [Acidimicrobiales bacterium]|jgi:enoyl-CoA hydratase|nr:enoyl-CoA hydratase/isomerase family protein [Acidimicrobiales bacterium]